MQHILSRLRQGKLREEPVAFKVYLLLYLALQPHQISRCCIRSPMFSYVTGHRIDAIKPVDASTV